MRVKGFAFCALLGICTALFSAISVSAETNCEIRPYMPKPERVFVDENFEDYEEGQRLPSSASELPGTVYSGGASDYPVCVKDGDNSYATTLDRKWAYFDIAGRPYSDAERLTLSFDCAVPYGNYNGFSVYCGSTWFFGFSKTGSSLTVKWSPNGGGSGETLISADHSEGGLINFTATLVRCEDGVYAESIVVNGTPVDSKKIVQRMNFNWWDNNIRIGNNATEMHMDNILFYEPAEFKTENVSFDKENGTINVECTGGVDISKSTVELICETGTLECSMTSGEDDLTKLIITPVSGIDTEKYTYRFKFRPVSTGGVEGDEYSCIFEKEYFSVIGEPSVVTEGDTVSAIIELEPKTEEQVWAVMSAWKGNKCLGCTVNKTEISDMIKTDLTIDNADEIDRIQLFFVDSTENMRLIHDVYNINR